MKNMLVAVAMLVSVMASATSIRPDVFEAVNLYSKDIAYSFVRSMEFRNGEKIPAANRDELFWEVRGFVLDRQLSLLCKSEILEKWVECQRSPRMASIRKRLYAAATEKEFREIAAEKASFIRTNYPELCMDTPEYRQLMSDMVKMIRQIYAGWKQDQVDLKK